MPTTKTHYDFPSRGNIKSAKYDLLNHFFEYNKGIDSNEVTHFNWPKSITLENVITSLIEDGWVIKEVNPKPSMFLFIGHSSHISQETYKILSSGDKYLPHERGEFHGQ